MMIKNGDEIEVKKINKINNAIQLNSSYPKNKLYANSNMITKFCKECEKWDVKDLLYVIGEVVGKDIKSIFFIYGDDYAADSEIYERIKSTIASGVNSIPNVDFAVTNELGRVNNVDPLGITFLRIRGMWQIVNPTKAFDYLNIDKDCKLIMIINEEKYFSFPESSRIRIEKLATTNLNFKIKNVKIKNPNNPAILVNSKLIYLEKNNENN